MIPPLREATVWSSSRTAPVATVVSVSVYVCWVIWVPVDDRPRAVSLWTRSTPSRTSFSREYVPSPWRVSRCDPSLMIPPGAVGAMIRNSQTEFRLPPPSLTTTSTVVEGPGP